MKLAIELSGEHDTLPLAEARSLARVAGLDVVDASLDRVLLLEGDLDATWWADRIALARRIVDVSARTSPDVDAIVAQAPAIPLDGERFAVRCSRLAADVDPALAQTIEQRLGGALADRGTVDLDAPERTVRVLLAQEALVGVDVARVDRRAFEARHVEARPYFSPVSLHPRLARALVNLSQIRAGERVWDPFVGTGGIALEAALVGAETLASDLDPEMMEGTRETLAHFGCQARLETGDVADVAERVGPVDAIVTDPPYGRASSTNKEELAQLYDRFFTAAANVLAPGGRLVTVLPEPEDAARSGSAFERVEQHAWYVHGTLTRHVTVLKRAGDTAGPSQA